MFRLCFYYDVRLDVGLNLAALFKVDLFVAELGGVEDVPLDSGNLRLVQLFLVAHSDAANVDEVDVGRVRILFQFVSSPDAPHAADTTFGAAEIAQAVGYLLISIFRVFLQFLIQIDLLLRHSVKR